MTDGRLTWSELLDKHKFVPGFVVNDYGHGIVDFEEVPALLLATLHVVEAEGLHVGRVGGQGAVPNGGDVLHCEFI